MKRITRCVTAALTIGLATAPARAQTAPPEAGETPPVASAPASRAAGPDERNVASRFVRDVGHDYWNYLSKDTAIWLGAGGAAALAVHAADQSVADWAQGPDSPDLAGGASYGSQLLHIPVAIVWWTLGAAAGSERGASAGRDLLRAQISVVSWTYAIKIATNRTRPNGDPRSFPSGHTSTSFATATVLQEYYGWKLGLPAFLAAAYSGISRVTANQHWASDVVFGVAVGITSGRTVTVCLRGQQLSLAPLAVPGGAGVLVTAMSQP